MSRRRTGHARGVAGAKRQRCPSIRSHWGTGASPGSAASHPTQPNPERYTATVPPPDCDSSAAVNRRWLMAVSSGVTQPAKRRWGGPCSNSLV